MTVANRQRMRLPDGGVLAYATFGQRDKPPLLLLHGFPNSGRMFRQIAPRLAAVAFVIVPDLPGFGESDPQNPATFTRYAVLIRSLLDEIAFRPRYIYLHDFGAPVGLLLALQAPEMVAGLIVQNANAHTSGLGPQWDDTKSYWSHPTTKNEIAATAHLTFEGTRDQYLSGLPPELAAKIPSACWEEDWRIMNLPGRMQTQRDLIADYRNHVARFDAIRNYLRQSAPPSLMVWGRHDVFFDLSETVSWLRDLPRMEAHILDAGHQLLETHAEVVRPIIEEFILVTEAKRWAATPAIPR